MLEFIQLLKQRYQNISSIILGDDQQKAIYQQRIGTLNLAESFIQKGQLIETSPDHSLQIAVIGPTQAGKSSITNLLLASKSAGVSPLAGFTVHPQGYCYDLKENSYRWIQSYFSEFQQIKQSELNRTHYKCYALSVVGKNSTSPLPSSVLWDTPDFDSIDAEGYREGVLRTVALADIIILVLSKEKYADQSVWEIMNLLAPLNQPIVIFVNKLVENSKSIVLQSLEEKWQQARNDPFPEVVPLYYQSGGGLNQWPEGETHRLNRIFKSAQKKSHRRQHKDYQQQFLISHWQNWVEPVKAEHEMLLEWEQLIDKYLGLALENYKRDFLNHPHHYETFQNAIAELLMLLEIPGLAKVLGFTRKILTWPARKLLQIGQSGVSNTDRRSDSSHEVELLNQISEHMLISVADDVLGKIDQQHDRAQWWKEINSLLRQQRTSVLNSFQSSVKLYHAEFQSEIEAAAHRLHDKLQAQPFTLNSLRATRITTDAVAVALALQTGGIGLHDLIITPAMLSVTSLLAEGAMGTYMSRIEVELKKKQLDTVKQRLFKGSLQSSLSVIPELMDKQSKFNISPDQLQAMEQTLKEKRHGLQLF